MSEYLKHLEIHCEAVAVCRDCGCLNVEREVANTKRQAVESLVAKLSAHQWRVVGGRLYCPKCARYPGRL